MSCTENLQHASSEIASSIRRTSDALISMDKQLEESQEQKNAPENSNTEIYDDKNAEALPLELKEANAIVLVSRNTLTLPEILVRLEAITGLAHILYLGPSQVRHTRPKDESMDYFSKPTGSDLEHTGASGGLAELAHAIKPNLAGSLEEVLDEISRHFDVGWRYVQGRIELRQYIIRSYHIHALPNRSEATQTVGNTISNISLDLTEEIPQSIAGIAGRDAIITYGGGTGTLIVNTRPGDQLRVAEFINELNRNLGHQIAFDITVLTVAASEASGFGSNLILTGTPNSDTKIQWSSNNVVANPSQTVNVGIISGNVHFDAIITALNKRGNVSVETRTGATTSNNRIVPIQVVRETAYAERVEASPDANGVIHTTINPGSLTTGFEMVFFPRMLNKSEVMLNYSIKLSELNELAEFTSDRQSIQLPRVSTTLFEQQAILSNGETLVLAGFERDRTISDRNGILFLGGKNTATVERIATVILIRSRILVRV